MRLAVLGGSFNPIHIGHLALADEVCVELGYDRIAFVPTFIPPHKTFADTVSAVDRLEMVKRVCQQDDRFFAESCEIDRGGTSYTFDTIEYLEKKYAGQLDDKIGLIMGDDLLPGFHLWYRAEELSRKCNLILARRPQSVVQQKTGHENHDKGMYGQVAHATVDENGKKLFEVSSDPLFAGSVSIKNPELVISSTDIRQRASSGRSFKYLVPVEVFKYIVERNIYGNNQ